MSKINFNMRQIVEHYQNQFSPEERPSQAQIAIEIGINPVTLSRYVMGKVERPDLKVVAQFCDYFGIEDMNEIFEYQKETE